MSDALENIGIYTLRILQRAKMSLIAIFTVLVFAGIEE